jgi:hypothetical protein
LLKQARESGVSGASAAPVTTASASPCWIIRSAVPIAWLPAAQAETTLKTGPRSPCRSESAAEPALHIMSGTPSGDTESGPPSRRWSWLLSSVSMPPIPVPRTQPMSSAS